MNIVLATWYETLPLTKVSGLDAFNVEPAHAVRRLWLATGGDPSKVATLGLEYARHIDVLGGHTKASEAIESADAEMRVWDQAEEVGKQSAIRNFELMMATNDPERRKRITRLPG